MRKVLIAALTASVLAALVAQGQTPANPPKTQAPQAKPQSAAAPAKTNLTINPVIRRELRAKGPDGRETVTYVPVRGAAQKGDVLIFTINYTNDSPAENKSDIMHGIQPGLVFVDAGGDGTAVFVSSDRGENWARHPAFFRSKNKQGKMVELPVPPEKITHVRWVFEKPLKPGQSGSVSLKVKVL